MIDNTWFSSQYLLETMKSKKQRINEQQALKIIIRMSILKNANSEEKEV
jgi:hypothetical protein